MARNLHQSHDAPGSGSQQTPQILHTQAPFGTQFQQPTRDYPDSDESPDPDGTQSVGTNRLEPMKLGNRHTKCVEIRPGQGATQFEEQQRLLDLLRKPKEKTQPTNSTLQVAFARLNERPLQQSRSRPTAPVKGWIMSSFARPEPSLDQEFFNEEYLQPENLGPDVQDTAPPPWEMGDLKTEPLSPRSPDRPGNEALSQVSGDKEAADSAEGQHDRAARVVPELDTASGPECSWMKGFIFNSDTLKVSKLQQQCLTKDTSWLYPPPGCPPFQDGNMPQSILAVLHRIADERANAEDDETSGSDSDINPSPDSLPVGINLSAESVPQTTQESEESEEEGLVSQWSVSPKSPPRPLRPHQDLPPDSSPAIQKSDVEQPSMMLPKSSFQHSEVVDSSYDEPLAVQNLAISDDDMEMEECIPQALGEDLPEKTNSHTGTPVVSSPERTQQRSVVQVRETPYGKGKTAQHMDGISPRRPVSQQTPNSSGESNDKSSSIVYSTSTSLRTLSPVGIAQNPTNERDTTQTDQRTIPQARRDSQSETAAAGAVHASEDVQTVDDLVETASLSGTTPKPLRSQGLSPGSNSNTPQAVSRLTKRKLPVSTVRENQGKSKRREIRHVGFGDMTPPTVDPLVKLREERAESLRRFREQRNSSTSFGSPHQPTRAFMDKQSKDATDLDSADMLGNEPQSDKRSPRHESLYEDPSPRPVRYNTPVQSRPLHRESRLQDQPRSSQAKHRDASSLQPQYASTVLDEESHGTVFESFKTAYPEYNGDVKHFHNQCKQMHKLDLEDKMVPKWQWDDFIIRNRTDYRDYAMECLDRSETPEPYHRFYKDKIRNTLYRRGIIKGRQTLEQALEEVGIAIEDVEAPGKPPMGPPSRPSLSRRSLPGSFDQMQKPRDSSVAVSRARSRQSLPVSSYAQQHYQQGTPSVSRNHTPRQLHPSSSYTRQHYQQNTPSASRIYTPREQLRISRSLQPEHASDPYRSFFYSHQQEGNNKPSQPGQQASIADLVLLTF